MSASSILSQARPNLLNAFPGWRQPVHLRAQFTTSGGVVTMVAAETTPGLVVTDTGTGVYALAFPPCRRIAAFLGNVSPATPAAGANFRQVVFDTANAAKAATGTITFRTIENDTATAAADPEDGSTTEVTFWADLG